MVFRWSIWGNELILASEVLFHSVGTFRRYFGRSARYVVSTDNPDAIDALFKGSVEIVEMSGSLANLRSHTVWQKWAPAVRLYPKETEVYVDIDVFIVGDPFELKRFCEGRSRHRFIAMEESEPDPRLYGLFHARIPPGCVQINAGLVGQQAGFDLTNDFARELSWWKEMVGSGLGTFPDEQGAVAAALAPYAASGLLAVLPAERYKIVSPRSNCELSSLDGVALIHATHRSHPAFAWFKEHIIAKSCPA